MGRHERGERGSRRRGMTELEERTREMRRQLVSLTIAGMAVLATGLNASPVSDDTPANAAPTVAVQRVSLALPAVRDEAAMVLIGTALIGLAAAVRRAA
jgi:hypothetical protein